MKRGVVAVVIEPRCYKFRLPNGKVVDVLLEVIVEITRWLQTSLYQPESGGYILGYEHKRTKSVSLEFVTAPQANDIKSRISFQIKDENHRTIMDNAKVRRSYYMGVWHTHPQRNPIPSSTDWHDWNSTMHQDKTACDYIFFMIAGTETFRIWVGDIHTKIISEIFEYERENRLYLPTRYGLDRMI